VAYSISGDLPDIIVPIRRGAQMKGLPDSTTVYVGVKTYRRLKKGNISGGLENLGWDAMDRILRKYEEQQKEKAKVTK